MTIALWVLVAVVSPASEIVCRFLLGAVPPWLLWCRIAVLLVAAAIGAYDERARKLRVLCLAYVFQLAVVAVHVAVREQGAYRTLVQRYGFVGGQLTLHTVSLVLLVPAIIWLLRRPGRSYLRIGNLTATIEPIGTSITFSPLRWSVVGPIFGLVGALSVWLFVAYEGAPVVKLWGMVPWAVLFASINAFTEELLYRNMLVPAVQTPFGTQQALLVSAFIFGIGHWNGLPSGPAGVLLTFVLGYVAAKAMVDTKGTFWPWFMHVLPDCVLFYYWGIGSVAHATIGSIR